MIIHNKKTQHTPLDFICDLEDVITELISEIDIDITRLKSYHAYKGYKDEIEYSYDADEAYPLKLAEFQRLLKKKGWYYMICHGTTGGKKWQKATKNKKLYNRIQNLILDLTYHSF